MVEKLWRPPELVNEKEEMLQRIESFFKYAELGKEKQKELSVDAERTLLKYMLYNQNVLTFSEKGRNAFTNSLNGLKVESERKGFEKLKKVIDTFGYIPEDTAYDILTPYMSTHKNILYHKTADSSPRFAAHVRARSLVALLLNEEALKKKLWEPRTEQHLEYWVWWELKSRDVFKNWPLVYDGDNKVGSTAHNVIYAAPKYAGYLKPEFRKAREEFIELHRKDIDTAIKKFDSQLVNFGYEKEGRDIFLRCGLTADWIIAFEIPLNRALELAKTHPEDWMEKKVLIKYAGVELPQDGAVETWKANMEYSRQNDILFKNNTAILITDHEKFKELHVFFVKNKINFNNFLKLFKGDPERIEENHQFCLEKNIPFDNCLELLIIPNGKLQENYKLYVQFWERVKPSEYPYLLTESTNVLKRRFGVKQPQEI